MPVLVCHQDLNIVFKYISQIPSMMDISGRANSSDEVFEEISVRRFA
jgi:hypothetical protein